MDNVLPHRRLRRRTAALMAGLVVVLLAASTSPARAQEQDPTPTAKALTLATPGIVSVSVKAKVSVQLHRAFRDLVGTRKFDFSTRPLTSGSGMAVSPDWVVTASHVVDFDEEQEDVARIYAANRLFFDRLELKEIFGELSGTEMYEEQRLSDPVIDGALQDCYNEDFCKFDVKPDVTVVAAVQVGGENKAKRLPARVRANTHFDGGDIAALQLIDADPMPTVPLATSAGELQGGHSVVAMGFPGSPARILRDGLTEPSSTFGHVSNVTSDGSSQVIQVDMNIENGMSGGPGLDEEGKVIGLISYSGLDQDGNRTHVYLRTADDIRSVLREVGVQPSRGEIDAAWNRAMEYYWAHHYSAALPLFKKVEDLQEGHLLASKYLRLAQAKAGGPDDVPLPSPTAGVAGGRGLAFWALVALGVLIVVALVLLALGWRRRRAASDPAYLPVPPDGGRLDAGPSDGGDHDEPALEHDDAMPTPVASAVGGMRAMDGAAVPANSGRPAFRRDAVMVQSQEAAARSFCPYCGTRLAPEARFCSGCGQAQ